MVLKQKSSHTDEAPAVPKSSPYSDKNPKLWEVGIILSSTYHDERFHNKVSVFQSRVLQALSSNGLLS